jgi:hypothetical protein
MPGDSGELAVNTRAHTSLPPARTGLRVHWAPGIPHALFNEGDEIFKQTSGVTHCEIVKSYLIAVVFDV